MDMDITDLVKIIAQMSGMNDKEREQLEELVEQFEDLDEIEDISDLQELDFEQFDLEEFDLDGFNFDFDGGLGPRPGNLGVDDFRRDSEEEEVDVEVPNERTSSEPYHGQKWMEVEGKYETFVEIPEDVENTEISITFEDSKVSVSEPVGESLSTDQLPERVTEIDVEQRGRRLFIRVY